MNQFLKIHKMILKQPTFFQAADFCLYLFACLLGDQSLDLFFMFPASHHTGAQFIRKDDQKPVSLAGA